MKTKVELEENRANPFEWIPIPNPNKDKFAHKQPGMITTDSRFYFYEAIQALNASNKSLLMILLKATEVALNHKRVEEKFKEELEQPVHEIALDQCVMSLCYRAVLEQKDILKTANNEIYLFLLYHEELIRRLLIGEVVEIISARVTNSEEKNILKEIETKLKDWSKQDPKGRTQQAELFINKLSDSTTKSLINESMERYNVKKWNVISLLQKSFPLSEIRDMADEKLEEFQEGIEMKQDVSSILTSPITDHKDNLLRYEYQTIIEMIRKLSSKGKPLPTYLQGNDEQLRKIIGCISISLTATDSLGNTLMHYVLSKQYRNFELAAYLHRLDPNLIHIINNKEQTPLDLIDSSLRKNFAQVICHGKRDPGVLYYELLAHYKFYKEDNEKRIGINGILRTEDMIKTRTLQINKMATVLEEMLLYPTDKPALDMMKDFLEINLIVNDNNTSHFLGPLQKIYFKALRGKYENELVCSQLTVENDIPLETGTLPVIYDIELQSSRNEIAKLKAENERLRQELNNQAEEKNPSQSSPGFFK